MTKLRRGVDECAGFEEKGHRSITTGDGIGRERTEAQRRAGVQRSGGSMVIRRKGHAAMMETLTSATRTAICVVHSLDGAVVFDATVATDPAIIFTALAPWRRPALAQNSSSTDATEATLRSPASICSMSVHARMRVRAFLEMRMPRDSWRNCHWPSASPMRSGPPPEAR